MFEGTIPQDMRNILNQVVATWDVEQVAVACSGNFTVERLLHETGRFQISGCDVTLYSCALGAYFAGKPFRLEFNPDYEEHFGYMAATITGQVETLATLMLATNVVKAMNARGVISRNPFYRRLMSAYREQWKALHEKTVERIQKISLRLNDFNIGDAVPWLECLPEQVAVISFPPFFARGYDKMWANLERIFAWDKPVYEELFEGHRERFLKSLTRRRLWAFCTHYRVDAYESYLRGVAQTTSRGIPIYLYSATGITRIITPFQTTEPVFAERLTTDTCIGNKMTIAQLTRRQFQSLRSIYLDANIQPARTNTGFAVLVDGLVVGCFALTVGHESPYSDANSIYLMSDFAVAPSDYPRLSKLILYATLSNEAKIIAERLARHRIRWIYTTAFSDNPVSMKYRGLFELHGRKEHTEPGKKRYEIMYKAPMGAWSLSEALTEWKQKFGTPSM